MFNVLVESKRSVAPENVDPKAANGWTVEGFFVCRAEIGDLKTLRADKAGQARVEKLAKLESKLAEARHTHVTLSELLEKSRATVAAADLPGAVASAKIILGAKRKARRFTKQLVAFFHGESNVPTFDAWNCPAEITATIAKETATLEKLRAKPESDMWKSRQIRRSRMENLRRKIVQIVTPAVAESLNVPGVLSGSGYVPGNMPRNKNNEPRIYIHRVWESPFHEFTQARKWCRTLPADIGGKVAEIENLEWEIAKLNKKMAEMAVQS